MSEIQDWSQVWVEPCVMERWLCNSDQAYKITGVIHNGVSACIEDIFTLLGEDVFNSEHSNEK